MKYRRAMIGTTNAGWANEKTPRENTSDDSGEVALNSSTSNHIQRASPPIHVCSRVAHP